MNVLSQISVGISCEKKCEKLLYVLDLVVCQLIQLSTLHDKMLCMTGELGRMVVGAKHFQLTSPTGKFQLTNDNFFSCSYCSLSVVHYRLAIMAHEKNLQLKKIANSYLTLLCPSYVKQVSALLF